MSRKYNTKHPERGMSHYPERLARRDLSRTPEMESLSTLRKRQDPDKKFRDDGTRAGWDFEEFHEKHRRL